VLADTPFTSFAFPATGEPTARTMPDRLAEIKNVKDFGAKGDGVTDDSAAIQAAVNWTTGANRGTIYFPIGNYILNSSITFNYDGNLSIRFLGEGPATGISNGPSLPAGSYLFDRHLTTPNNTTGGRIFEKLTMQNSQATGGCIRIGSTIGAFIRDCYFGGNTCVTTEDSVGNSSQNILFENCTFASNATPNPGNAIIIGGSGAIAGCYAAGVDTAIRAYGSGLQCLGNRIEVSNTAYLFGLDSGGNNRGASGFAVTSGSTEGVLTSFDLAGTCSGFVLGPMQIMGHDSTNAGSPHANCQYGVRVRAVTPYHSAGVFNQLSVGSFYDVACFSIANASSRANLAFINCQGNQNGGAGVNWITPTNAYTAVFQNCNVQPVWTYSQLPSGGNLLEGDEFTIRDSTTATWGATVSGSGTNHALVRYNGTNWTVVGV